MSLITGLTTAQVEERRHQGQGNDVEMTTSRSYKDIIIQNVFNPVNIVLYVISAGLTLMGDFKSAFATIMLVAFNAIVGIIQEMRSKKQLDEIALLAIAKISVRRDGAEVKINPSELVLGDILIIRAGDQIPVDGKVVGEGKIEVDESALTGEADLIAKLFEETVLSGSFCVTGETLVEATGVGEASFANTLTQNAREFKLDLTPLQIEVNRLLRIMLLLVMFFGYISIVALFTLDLPLNAWLQVIAVITGSVSAGLLTLITLNYSLGAVRIGQKGGLVQQINAIESLSNVTVLCTDKTGTLTANKIKYHDVYPIGIDKTALEQQLADFGASAGSTNKTSEAIIGGLPGTKRIVTDEVAFSSARKWSAIAFNDPAMKGVYVLGAFEMLQDSFSMSDNAHQQLITWSNEGLRVLVLAHNPEVTTLHDGADEPILPPLTLIGVVSFSDELRPHLNETLNAFTENGVKLKVISGDNPQTVAALAKQAGLPGDLKAVSGPELAQMSPAEFTQTAVDATVFGRITPQQKEALVDALRNQGEYVAMMGDGVNDVLSLKKANVGIAMESGSTATRSVAAIVLLGDSFEAMPLALLEGQRIVNSIQNILKLFMVTVFGLLMLIIGITMLGLGFPFTTLQNTLLSFFARGVPPLILAMVAQSGRTRGNLFSNLIHFTIPASFLVFAFGLLVYIGVFFMVQHELTYMVVTHDEIIAAGQSINRDYNDLSAEQFKKIATVLSAQTALTVFFVMIGLMTMIFAEPPVAWLTGGVSHTSSWLTTIAGVGLFTMFLVIMMIPGLRSFFDLVSLPLEIYLALAGTTALWVVLQLAAWRGRWFEKLLDMEEPIEVV